MLDNIKPYKVYVKVNSDGYVTAVNSSAFLKELDGWIQIDEGHGDKYRHAQSNYFGSSIISEGGAWLFKLVDGNIINATEEEVIENEDNVKRAYSAIPTMSERMAALEAAMLEMIIGGA